MADGAQSPGEFTTDLAEDYPSETRLDALGRVVEYGVVIDTDGDLRPDCHLGISNDNDTTAELVDLHVWLKTLPHADVTAPRRLRSDRRRVPRRLRQSPQQLDRCGETDDPVSST
jgi:hypothetical protein